MLQVENLKQKYNVYSVSFLFSIIVHLVFILFLVVSIQTKVKPSSMTMASGDIIQASMVDEKQVQNQIKRLETQEIQKKQEEQKKQELLRGEEQKKIEALKQMNQKMEQAAIAQEQANLKAQKVKEELQKTKEDEQSHLAQIRMEKEKEQKALEALKKEKAKEEKRLAAIDEKRQEEQERATQMRLEREKEEKKKKELLEAKRKVEEDKKMSALKAEEDARIAAENAERLRLAQGEFKKYEGIIRDKVKGCWVRPSGLPSKLQCKLEINAMPDGEVINVKIVASSGNEAFDQSAIAAVRKAVPLPFPQGEPDVMNLLRHFTLEFIPDENSEVANEM